MEDNISFDPATLESLVEAISVFSTNVNEANSYIQEQITTINSNWSGPLHEAAKIDLDNIQTSMPTVVKNTAEAYKILAEVAEGFSGITY